MNTKLSNKLYRKYKFLRKKEMPTINCGDGWYELVNNMCSALQKEDPPKDFVITAIYEKCGELRVHSKNGAMKTRVIIDEYNTVSLDTCDECGQDKDLESCSKCKVPVVVYASEEEEGCKCEDGNCSCDPDDSGCCGGGCSGGGCSGGNCSP